MVAERAGTSGSCQALLMVMGRRKPGWSAEAAVVGEQNGSSVKHDQIALSLQSVIQ